MRRAGEFLRETVGRAMEDRDRLTVSQWADKYRQVVVGSKKGQWSTDSTPYLRGVMDAFSDPLVREITVMSARQMGKTEGALYNPLFWMIDCDPRDTMIVYPTKEMAVFNNRRRFLPTLKRTPRVRRWLGKSPRDAGAMELNFGRMMVRFVGSNSEANLESYPYPCIGIDEVDRCDPDTIPQCRESLKTFAESKLFKASTPSYVGVGIDAEYNGTQVALDDDNGAAGEGGYVGTPPADRRKFVVPCPHCGVFHTRTFTMVRWEGGRSARPELVKRSAWMECPGCSQAIRAADNMWQLHKGVWAPVRGAGAGAIVLPRPLAWDGVSGGGGGRSGPDAERAGAVIGGGSFDDERERMYGEHVGFAVSGLFGALEPNPYGSVAAKWVAIGGQMTRSFVNRTLGEAWAVKGEFADVREIAARAGGYEMGQVPAGVLAITVGVDVQQDRVFAEVLGWGERGEVCWMIECHEIARVRGANLVELDNLAKKTWTRADGRMMRVIAMGVDSGKYTDEVYRWVAKWRPGLAVGQGPRVVWAVKGEQGLRSPLPYRESAVTARSDRAASHVGEGQKLLIVNTSYWKEHILARLSGRGEGPAGEMVLDEFRFPTGVPRGYLMQLTAEQLVRERKGAQVVTAWALRPGRTANHYGDCRVYGCAIAHREGVQRLLATAAGGGVGGKGASGATPRVERRGAEEGERRSLLSRARERGL